MTKYYRFERVLGAMKRFYEKISLIHDGVEAYYPPLLPEPEETDLTYLAYPLPKSEGNDLNLLQDYVLTFFIFCHSLKDWIRNDKEINKEIRDKVESFISSNPCLKITADIANGAKHLERKKGPRSKVQPEWLRTQTKVSDAIIDGYKRQIVRSSGYFLTERGETDARALASECLSKWEEFIGKNIYREKQESKNS